MHRLVLKALFGFAVAAALALPTAAPAYPIGPKALDECFQSTHRKPLNANQILAGLDLTPDQTRKLRFRLIGYPWTNQPTGQFGGQVPPGQEGLDGIGLTSEQLAVIWSRIRAQEKAMNLDKPVGWPCQPFRNPSRVVAFARGTLIYNGFRPNAMFRSWNRRQIGISAIRDGIAYTGTIVKSGPRQIAISLSRVPTIGNPSSGGSPQRFAVTFDA